MAASFAWLSVLVHRRLAVVVNRKIVQCEWCDTFAEVLEKLDPQLASVSVEKVTLCSNEQFRDPVHVAPLNAPVELCRSYGFNVCYHLEDGEPVEQDGRPTHNAFQILMSSHTQRILPGRIEGDSLRGDQRLRNAVIDVLEKAQIGWSPQMVSSAGSACVSQITSLWYLLYVLIRAEESIHKTST